MLFRSSLIEGYRGGFYVCYKHYGPIVYSLYRVLVLIDIIPRLIWHMVLSAVREKNRAYAAAYFKIIMIDLKNDIFLVGKKKVLT